MKGNFLTSLVTANTTYTTFENQLSKIKSFMSWNGFPKYVGRSIIKKTLQKKKGAVTDKSELDEIPIIWFKIPVHRPNWGTTCQTLYF